MMEVIFRYSLPIERLPKEHFTHNGHGQGFCLYCDGTVYFDIDYIAATIFLDLGYCLRCGQAYYVDPTDSSIFLENYHRLSAEYKWFTKESPYSLHLIK